MYVIYVFMEGVGVWDGGGERSSYHSLMTQKNKFKLKCPNSWVHTCGNTLSRFFVVVVVRLKI